MITSNYFSLDYSDHLKNIIFIDIYLTII